MERLTFKTVKESNIPGAIGLCSTDDRFRQTINEAHSRLVKEDKWWGTYQRYDIAVGTDGSLLWPRQVAAIEAFAVNDVPQIIRNGWFEYLPSGNGLRANIKDSGELQLIDHGMGVVFESMPDNDHYVQVYSETEEASGARILIQGYDHAGQWVRTQDSGTWIDGEYLSLGNSTVTSTKKYSHVTGIVKPVTSGNVRLNRYKSPGPAVPIGFFEPSETNPTYRRSLIPGLKNAPDYTFQDTGTTIVNKRMLQTIVKLDHIDVSHDNDFLVLMNLPALKLAAKAVLLESREDQRQAEGMWAKARQLLSEEVKHYEGSGVVDPLNIQYAGSPGEAGNIQ